MTNKLDTPPKTKGLFNTSVKLNFVDRAVSFVSPRAGLNRIHAKVRLELAKNLGYTGGSTTKHYGKGYNPGIADSDRDDLPQRDVLVGRSRDMFRNNPIGGGAIRRARTNIVGSGLRLQCEIDRKLLGLDDAAADAWETDVESRFDAYASNKLSDKTKTQNFYENQNLAFTSAFASGDVFALLPTNKRKGIDSDLRISLYESDYVCNPLYMPDTKKTAGGITFDKNGAPKTYHFRTSHPGSFGYQGVEWTEIPAYGAKSGRLNVIHLFQKDRPGQRRGIPFLAPVIEPLKQLDRFAESELMAAVVQSFFTVFIKSETGNTDFIQEGVAGAEKVTDQSRPVEANNYEMGSGNILGLADKESIEMASTNRPAPGFDKFFLAVVRQIGSILEIPFEQLILHFTSSYSAARASMLEAWKFYSQRRQWLATNFCDPIFKEWLYLEVLSGRIQAPGLLTNNLSRYAWTRAKWQGSGQGQIDPVKETKAAKMKVENNFSSHETEYNKMSDGNWSAEMARKSREKKFLIDKDINDPAEPIPDEPDDGNTNAADNNDK